MRTRTGHRMINIVVQVSAHKIRIRNQRKVTAVVGCIGAGLVTKSTFAGNVGFADGQIIQLMNNPACAAEYKLSGFTDRVVGVAGVKTQSVIAQEPDGASASVARDLLRHKALQVARLTNYRTIYGIGYSAAGI